MKTKQLLILFFAIFMLLVLGVYFAINAIFTEPASEKITNTPLNKKEISNTNAVNKNYLPHQSQSNQNHNEIAFEKTAKNENKNINKKIVDQTLSPPLILRKNEFGVNNSLSSGKIEIEITLFDSENGKLLMGYDVEINCKKGDPKTQRFKTDEKGVIIFKVSNAGLIWLYIFTKDYSIHPVYLGVSYGKNQYIARLYKGGKIEIRVANTNKNSIEGLMVKLWEEKKDWDNDFTILEKDNVKGLYILSNVPIGIQTFTFKAKGYFTTQEYRIIVEPNDITHLEIKLDSELDLQNARKLYFDIDLKSKPKHITISNSKISTGFGLGGNEEEFSSLLIVKEVFFAPQSFNHFSIDIKKLPVKNHEYSNNGIEIQKNNYGIYEYPLYDKEENSVALFVDNYVPQIVNIIPDIDRYTVNLTSCFNGKIIVKNTEGIALEGVIIDYSAGIFNNKSITDKEGIAMLTGLNEKDTIEIKILDKTYEPFNENWSFEFKDQNSKSIVLTKGNNIFGKVKFLGNEAMGATIYLFKTSQNTWEEDSAISDIDGNFTFNKIEENEYYIKAFHREMGVAISPIFNVSKSTPIIELELIEEKSLSIKLVDTNNNPLSNKQIAIAYNHNADLSECKTTDEKGKIDFWNLVKGEYDVEIRDFELRLNLRTIEVPNNSILITAVRKDLIKIKVNVPDNKIYKGVLKATEEGKKYNNSIEVILGEDGFYYADIPRRLKWEAKPIAFVFEAPGYANILLMADEKMELFLPKEVSLDFSKGIVGKIKVIDNNNLRAIPFVKVEVGCSAKICSQALFTNIQGEVQFHHLNEKVYVKIEDINYAPYENNFDVLQTDEMLVKLIKGGELIGRISNGGDATFIGINLLPNGPQVKADAKGNFKLTHIKPGEYKIKVIKILKNDKQLSLYCPTYFTIENEKSLEVNLDEYQFE